MCCVYVCVLCVSVCAAGTCVLCMCLCGAHALDPVLELLLRHLPVAVLVNLLVDLPVEENASVPVTCSNLSSSRMRARQQRAMTGDQQGQAKRCACVHPHFATKIFRTGFFFGMKSLFLVKRQEYLTQRKQNNTTLWGKRAVFK